VRVVAGARTGWCEEAVVRVLVADLGDTLLGGELADRRRLRDALARHREVVVVFATGHGLSSLREVLRDPVLPRPRWVIADIGATVVDGRDLTPLGALQARLRAGWPGAARVRAVLAGSLSWSIILARTGTAVVRITYGLIS
jgi:hypothetical protein